MAKPTCANIQQAYEDFGGRCAFPDCPYEVHLKDTPIFEVAFIRSNSPGGPRYDPNVPAGLGANLENILILCPHHHYLIDTNVSEFTTERLSKLRQKRIASNRQLLAPVDVQAGDTPHEQEQPAPLLRRLTESIEIWHQERQNPAEEYWHRLFASRPEILMQVTEGRAYTFESKCYLGGKSVKNRGGEEIDFLGHHAGNCILIEIKTPSTRLMAGRYRNNVYTPSSDLVGTCMQLLEYRWSLIANIHALSYESGGLAAANPLCVAIIGDLAAEDLSAAQRHSFETFRSSLAGVRIVTYDELFSQLSLFTSLGP